jgi:hypothetical protein
MRRKHLVLALSVVAITALGASPATAGTNATTSFACTPAIFDGLAALSRSGTTRALGTTLRTEKDTERFTGPADGQKTPGKPTAGTIPVYFHVVYAEDGTGNVSQAAVEEQIDVLNITFGGMSTGFDTGFRFELADVDWTENDAWFEQATFEDEVAMKSDLKQGGPTDLNVYSTSGGGFLGWAYYPNITTSNQFEVLDGVVIHFGSLPGGPITNYNLGYTATHEVGHYLGLAHTFDDGVKGCIGHGDYVDDTPFMVEPTSGCPADGTKDSCPKKPGFDPIHNYMDYSYDICYTEFTQGQAERMQKQYAHWRLKRA